MLLFDVFENFREICVGSYHLDPFPRSCLGCHVKNDQSQAAVFLSDDIDMIVIIEQGIWGECFYDLQERCQL